MTRLRLVALLSVTAVVLAVLWFWFTKPVPIDLALYAPADSLLYLESNNPLKVASTIVETDAWKSLTEGANLPSNPPATSWLNRFVYWTGLGPVENVILVRSQVAVVLMELGTNEEGESLTIKPDGALLIETHTSERRIRQPAETSLQRIAEAAYGKPVMSRTTIEGDEFIEWSSVERTRQLVATISGSLIIIGNSRQVVQKCLATARGRSPSLRDDAELHVRRAQAGVDHLTFGYVPSQNSSKLLSIVVPLLLGRAPGDSDFQRVVMTGTSKILGSLAWSSLPFKGGIEDRYFISLQPSMVARLKPAFQPTTSGEGNSKTLPKNFYSATFYNFDSPIQTWQALKTSVSASVDTLSAVVFATLLRTSLVSYGINEPDVFLNQLKGEVVTVRLDQAGERSLLIGQPHDSAELRKALTTTLGFRPVSSSGDAEDFVHAEGEISVRLTNSLVVFGPRNDVQSYFEQGAAVNTLEKLTPYPPSSGSNVTTFTNDEERIESFVLALSLITNTPVRDRVRTEQIISAMPYSSTATTLTAEGLERVTRSSFGQFSTLLPLVVPERQIQTVGPPSK